MILKPHMILMNEVDDRGDNAGGGGDDTSDVDEQQEILAAASADADKDADKESASKGIPKARFDEAVGKEREARMKTEAKLQEAEARLKSRETGLDESKVEGEIATLEDEMDAAAADGDKAKVAAIRKEIRAKVMALATADASRQAAYATAVAVERVRYDAAVATLEAKYDGMNPDHADYDEALTGELIELKGAYEATGMGSTDALKKAAKYVFKDAPAEVKKEDPPADKGAAAEKAAKAKEEAIRRGLAAKDKQPPASMGKQAAKDPVGLDATKMSDKDFNKMSEDDKARLRGDMI